jgi:hypothetical protein
LRRQAIGVTSNEDRVNAVPAFAKERLRSEQSILTLSGLKASDKSDHRKVGWKPRSKLRSGFA